MIKTYRVTVEQRVPDDQLTKHDDRVDNPTGTYEYQAESEEHALDLFHNHVPIAMIEDFDITAEVVVSPERTAAQARHPILAWRYEVANGDTMRGYEDWLSSKMEQDLDEAREASA